MGINRQLPTASDLLKADVAARLVNLAEPLNIAELTSFSEIGARGSQLNAVPQAWAFNLQVLASLRLSGLPFPKLPDFAP